MAIDQTIPELDRRGLREFGLTTGGIVAALFGVLFPWLLERTWPVWPWIIAAPLWVLALLHPSWLRLIHRGWMRFGQLAGHVMTPLILGIVFFLLISPIAMFRRVAGDDPLRRAFDRKQETYRIPTRKNLPQRLERPF